jgi:hypothetical protein
MGDRRFLAEPPRTFRNGIYPFIDYSIRAVNAVRNLYRGKSSNRCHFASANHVIVTGLWRPARPGITVI